jgi:hypothetical protein
MDDECETRAVAADESTVDQLQDALARGDARMIGEAYAVELRRRLDQIDAWEEAGRSYELPAHGPVSEWLMIVWDGEDRGTGEAIDATLWLDLVITAADSLVDDEAVWCIGDGPADHLVGDHPEMGARLYAARASHPGVEAMFQAILAEYRMMGYPDAGWWSDPSALSGWRPIADPK